MRPRKIPPIFAQSSASVTQYNHLHRLMYDLYMHKRKITRYAEIALTDSNNLFSLDFKVANIKNKKKTKGKKDQRARERIK